MGWITEIWTSVFSLITDRSHEISHAADGKAEREKKLIPCLRENLSRAGRNLIVGANETGKFWADFRGSPLEVPYRNRKSRAAELN